jgi:hypothetical protein
MHPARIETMISAITIPKPMLADVSLSDHPSTIDRSYENMFSLTLGFGFYYGAFSAPTKVREVRLR